MPEIIELTILAPLILAVIGALRRVCLPDDWTPIVAIIVGIVLAVIAVLGAVLELGLVAAGFGGALAGAGAVGLHQTGKQLLDDGRPPRQTVRRGDVVPDRDPDTTDR